MLERFKKITRVILICIDQFLQTIVFGIPYLFFGGVCPSEDETISSVVGRNANKGNKVAIVAEKCIDFVFSLLGEKNHCQNSIEILVYRLYK